MGKGKSKWVEVPKVSDLTGIENLIDSIPFDTFSNSIDVLIKALQVVQSLLDVADVIVQGVENTQKAIFEGVIKALNAAKDELVSLLEEIFNFGVYILPEFEAFDFNKTIRNEILGGNIDIRSSNRDRFVDTLQEVPNFDNPKDTHYEVRRLYGGLKTSDYKQFIRNVIDSLNDPNDIARPVFDSSEKLSAVLLVAASEDLATFLLAYLLIVFFVSDDKELIETSEKLIKILKIAIGQQEFLGREFDSGKKERILLLIDTITNGIERAKEEGIKEFIKELLSLSDLKIESALTASPKFTGNVNISGESREYQVFQEESEQVTINDILNYENLAKANLNVNGTGELTIFWEFGDYKVSEQYGTVSGNVSVWIPLIPVAEATFEPQTGDKLAATPSGTKNLIAPKFDTPPDYLTIQNDVLYVVYGNDLIELKRPTKVTFQLEGTEGVSDQRTVYIPKFNRLSLEEKRQINDGYRQNIVIAIEPSGNSVKNAVADYLGISTVEVSRLFPVSFRTKTIDLSRFGPDMKEVDIRITVTPQVQINDSFTGDLIVNGRIYKPDDVVIRSTNATLTFKGVNLSESAETMLAFVSEIKTPVFVSTGSADNGIYTLRSEPNIHTVLSTGGLLDKVRITSPDKVSIADSFTGIENSPFVNRWNQTFGKPEKQVKYGKANNEDESVTGSKITESTPVPVKYRLSGRRNKGAFVYAIVSGEDKTNNSRRTLEIITNPFQSSTTINEDNLSEALSDTFFSQTIILPAEKDKKKTYRITVYQTTDPDKAQAILSILRESEGDLKKHPELEKRLDSLHGSKPAVKKVTVDTRNVFSDAPLPNWFSVSLGQFFPITESVDTILSDAISAFESSLPTGPYDQIQDWLDLFSDRIDDLIELLQALQDIIENLRRFINIGSDSLWALGISGANGVDGLKERILKQDVPEKLRNARFVTGVVLVVPNDFLGVPAGKILMDTVFAKLPSEGSDSAKPKQESLSFEDKLKEISKETAQSAIENINKARSGIKKLKDEDIVKIGKAVEDIE